MQALAHSSQRRTHAARFAHVLRQAIKARGASKLRVCEATGIPRSNLGYYLAGRNLPTVAVAKVLADVLDDDKLLRIVIDGRTVRCGREGCPRSFLYEGGKPKVYCSEDCASLAAKMRGGTDPLDEGSKVLYQAVKGEVDRVHGTNLPVSRRLLTKALDQYARSGSKRHARVRTVQRRVDAYAEAVDAMCRSCEPEGLCQQPECPLRAFSPLPLAGTYTEEKKGRPIREPEGPWGPTNRERQLVAVREANDRRWARPGERERARDLMLDRHASMSDDERTRWRALVGMAAMTPEARSAAATKAWETRRARRAEKGVA